MIKKAQKGIKIKAKAKSLPPAGKQRPVDFEPKSKYPVTPGGGDNYDETIKRERELKKKGMMKMGGAVKKKMQMGGSAESNKFTIPSKNKISIPKKASKDSSFESNVFTIPSRNKISIPKKKMMRSGGELSAGVGAIPKRVGPIDSKGAYIKVQERTLAESKASKPSLTKDKQLGATKMKKGGMVNKCKYGCK